MSPVFISTLQTAEDRFPAHRSSSRPTPDVIKSRLFSHRSTPRSSAKAPVSGLRPPPRKAAPEVQNFLHLLVQHRGPRATRPTFHVPVHNISFNALTGHRSCIPEVAPAPRRCRRRDAAPVSGVFPAGASFHLLEIRVQAIQLSAISRGSPSAPSRTPGHGRCFPHWGTPSDQLPGKPAMLLVRNQRLLMFNLVRLR